MWISCRANMPWWLGSEATSAEVTQEAARDTVALRRVSSYLLRR